MKGASIIFKEKILLAKKIILENRILVKISSFCLVGLIALIISIGTTGVTVGFKVDYKGEEIAVIRETTVFDSAKILAVDSVKGGNSKNVKLSKPSFHLTLTISNRLTDDKSLANMLIDRADNIVYATELKVNGDTAACVSNFDVEEYLNSCLAKYNIDGAENSSEFVDKVETQKGYFLAENIDNVDTAVSVMDKLSVKTVSTLTSDVQVPFSTVKEKTSAQVIGYSEVKTAGINGVNRVTEKIVTLNGVESERTELSNEVVSSPVTQVVVVGTARSVATASQRKVAYSQGFIFPLPKSSYIVTAYYGDGRNHKGVDLAADAGTPIYVVKDGTVVSSGWDGNYGYSMIVDHGNGIKTRYSHASKLLYAAGEKVYAGNTIALVGTTGMSTGNHLHFEVMINGVNYDPAPYIGLG